MFAVTVTFRLNPGVAPSFLPLMRENARESRGHEPGCRQFDVCTDPARPDQVFLYEIYEDADAFQAHLKTTHYREFDAATSELIAEKTVFTFASVVQ